VGQALVVAFVVTVIVFVLVRLVPGDPARGILGTHASTEAVAALRAQLHLNLPLWRQFLVYFGGLFRGDLGESVITPGLSVSSVLSSSLPVTLSIIVATSLISSVVGIAVGLSSALSGRRVVDIGVRAIVSISLASPPFLIALVLLFAFALSMSLLPAGGWGGGWPANLRYIVLPSVALSGYLAPLVIRTVRQAAMDVNEQEFVEAAIARGLPRRTVVLKHILPNSLLPLVTLLALNVGGLVGGAVVVEAVFGLPGIGTQLVQAVQQRDYTVIQGIALVTALIVVAANLCADLLYAVVDPRTRRQ
jgi:peptide/nickel transport system permease protein